MVSLFRIRGLSTRPVRHPRIPRGQLPQRSPLPPADSRDGWARNSGTLEPRFSLIPGRNRRSLNTNGNYRTARQEAGNVGDVNAPLDADAEITSILMNWPGQFGWLEDQTKQIVTSDLLRSWLGTDLDTEALPHGPLTPLLQYQVNMRPRCYTALATEGRLMAVVDKSELATRTTEEVLRRQLA